MKNIFKPMLHSVPALVLVVAMLLLLLPSQASAAVNSIDWFDHISRYYLSYYSQISAFVEFDRSQAIWAYNGGAVVTGPLYTVNSSQTVTLFPFGSNMLELSNLPQGIELHLDLTFEVAKEYTGLSIPYRVVLEYYGDSGGLLSRDVSGWVDATIVTNGSVQIDAGYAFNGYLDPDTGKMIMPEYCSIRFEFKSSTGISIKASLLSASMVVPFDDSLKDVLSSDRLDELGHLCFDACSVNWPTWFPDNWSSVQNILLMYFTTVQAPEPSVPPSEEGGFDFNIGIGEIPIILQQGLDTLLTQSGAFAAVSALFARLLTIPYVSGLIYMSLSIGIFALILNVPMRFDDGRNSKSKRGTKSAKKEAKTKSGGESSGKDGS